MKVVHEIVSLNKSVITIGAYDGIHLGHQLLIKKTVENARKSSASAVVVTFDPLPEEVIAGAQHFVLTLPEEKNALLEELGVDMVVYLRFDSALRSLDAQRFLEMIEPLSPATIVIGEDFRFGSAAAGNADLIRAYFGQDAVEVVPLLSRNGVVVKSSLVRKLIGEGKVEQASEFLGRSYQVYGKVVRGRGAGSRLGYPTANVRVSPRKLLPGPGVYAARAHFGERNGDAAVFVPQSGDIEVHVLGQAVDAYGMTMRITFIKRVSEVAHLPDEKRLKSKIASDIEKVKQALNLSY